MVKHKLGSLMHTHGCLLECRISHQQD